MEHDLTAIQAGNGEVQCIDSISGCGNSLLDLKLVQATGLLSDFFVFGSPAAPAVREARSAFTSAVSLKAPQYVIITDPLHLHPENPGKWSKLESWPWFPQWLDNNYTLVLTRYPTRPALWWFRPELPAAYRIYVRKDQIFRARKVLIPDKETAAGDPDPFRLPEL